MNTRVSSIDHDDDVFTVGFTSDGETGIISCKQLVIAATPHREVNQQVHADARALNLPVNVVDTPELCTFIFPSIVDRSPLVIGISSSARSPVRKI